MNLFGSNGAGASTSDSLPAKILTTAGSALTSLFGPSPEQQQLQLAQAQARQPSVFESPLVVLGVLALGGYLIYSIFTAKGR